MKTMNASLLATAVAVTLCAAIPAAHAAPAQPWADRTKTSAQRTELLLKAMTLDEKLLLLFGYASGDQLAQVDSTVIPGVNTKEVIAKVIPGSAGYIPGIPRLGIPPLRETDASLGVANQVEQRKGERTALPSSLATAASLNPSSPTQAGAMIGSEARASGFNVHARRRRQPDARSAQRPQLRIPRRGPAARRHDGRRADRAASSPTTSSRRSSISRSTRRRPAAWSDAQIGEAALRESRPARLPDRASRTASPAR